MSIVLVYVIGGPQVHCAFHLVENQCGFAGWRDSWVKSLKLVAGCLQLPGNNPSRAKLSTFAFPDTDRHTQDLDFQRGVSVGIVTDRQTGRKTDRHREECCVFR